MKEVKELVEWVAGNLWDSEKRISAGWEYLKYMEFNKLPDGTKGVFRKQAKQILSHPKLALIVDRELPSDEWFTNLKNLIDPSFVDYFRRWTAMDDGQTVGERQVKSYLTQGGFKPVIPLAEALKEDSND